MTDAHAPSAAPAALTASHRLEYQPALDGIRGVAIAVVLLAHGGFATFPNSGNVGVTLFFVLSGFLITTLLLQERFRSGGIDLRAFYWRRAIRLIPALLLLLAGVSLLMVAVGRSSEIAVDVAPTLFYIVNWTKAAGDDTGYLSHAWSLSIEELFYIVWPLLLIGGLHVARGRLLPLAIVVSGAAAAIALWRAALWSEATADRVLWATDTRADALLIGCAAALFVSVRPVAVPASLAAASRAAIAAVLVFSSLDGFATSGLAIVAVGTVPLVVGASGDNVIMKSLSWRPLVFVGTISYGLYLFHRPIMRLGADWGMSGSIVPFAVLLLVSIAIAALSWRYVERPLLRLKQRPPHARAAPMQAGPNLASSPAALEGRPFAGAESEAEPTSAYARPSTTAGA